MRSGDQFAFALVGGKVITAPGRILDPGVVVVRGGVIQAVGAPGKTAIPEDARVFEMKGKTIHAAFLDPYVSADRLAGKRPRAPLDEEEAAPATRVRPRPPPAPSRCGGGAVLTLSTSGAAATRTGGWASLSSTKLRPRASCAAKAPWSLSEEPLEERVLESEASVFP